jgi:hypothetical protein
MSHTDATQLTPVLFRDGLDRRKGARVPVSGPVRMGPPHGEPYAMVSASNMSSAGLFIDADRPVRVGARFSATIPVGSDMIYVPEAEVAYNRDQPHSTGFGVRFIDPPIDVVQRIEAEVDRVITPAPQPEPQPQPKPKALPTMPPPARAAREAKATDPSEQETIRPARRAKRTDLEVIECPPEPAFDDLPSEIPPIRDTLPPRTSPKKRGLGSIWEETMRKAHEARHRFVEGTRRYPTAWIGLATGGALLVIAAGVLAVYRGSWIEQTTDAPVRESRGITSTTQQVLMGEHPFSLLVEAPPPAMEAEKDKPVEPKKPLPPLVTVEDALKAKAAQKPAPKTPARPSRAELTSAVAKPHPARKPKSAKLHFAIGGHASVLKTHVFKSPSRFVIDVAGQEGAPSLPAPSGAIKQIRFGKHPDFARVVIETEAPIDAGRVSKDGKELRVTIDFAD